MKESLIEFMRHDAYRPLTLQELAEAFGIGDGAGLEEFTELLQQMEQTGEVVRTRTRRYGLPERMNLAVGRLQMKARGYGFLLPEVPGEPDVYIAAADMNGALAGDKIMARVEKTNGPRREGQVIRVLERAENRIVGKFVHQRDHGFVTPLDKRFPQDLFVAKADMMDAHDGYVVVAEITEYPTPTRGPEGRIVEVLGHPDAPGIDILGVVRKYGLAEDFPPEVLRAAEAIPLDLSAEDYEGRRDLRDEVVVTIDGEDAKDLDDAVQVEQLANGNYRLGVHIADVGYYVKEGSALDKEAFRRATSVYLVDRVIPMLPQRLSNNICSLNPQVDRLTLSCVMEIAPDGEITKHDVFPSVIRTTERMTYAHVRRILIDRDEGLIERYRPLVPMFEKMEELAEVLNKRRMRRGAIDFNFDEVKVVVDDEGHPVDIVPRPRSVAERLIEEFMLAANETVAEHFHRMDVPFVYRIHEEPTEEKMLEYNEFIHNFGYRVQGLGKKVKPRALQEVLNKAQGTREERVIATLMLRSMRQARYSPECVGHFGLAAEYYTHFTSPIRRYPDLCIHRIIREVLAGGLSDKREQRLREFVETASIQSSERERVAQDAERECDQLKMVEFMQEHVGEEFDGMISGVTQFGLFVQLPNGVEGLIHISYLNDDYYVFNEKHVALVGERTRRVFRLGDPIRVEVTGASKENLTIDFGLIAHHREGTMVEDAGLGMVVYDEDLNTGDRKRAIRVRQEKSRDRAAERERRAVRLRGRPGDQAGVGSGTPGAGTKTGRSEVSSDKPRTQGNRAGRAGQVQRQVQRQGHAGQGQASQHVVQRQGQANVGRALPQQDRQRGQRRFSWAEHNRRGGYELDPALAASNQKSSANVHEDEQTPSSERADKASGAGRKQANSRTSRGGDGRAGGDSRGGRNRGAISNDAGAGASDAAQVPSRQAADKPRRGRRSQGSGRGRGDASGNGRDSGNGRGNGRGGSDGNGQTNGGNGRGAGRGQGDGDDRGRGYGKGSRRGSGDGNGLASSVVQTRRKSHARIGTRGGSR